MIYYLVNNQGNTLEIRKKVRIGGILKYIIDSKAGIKYVTSTQFYQIPINHKLIPIK